jgi:hypothetical protein
MDIRHPFEWLPESEQRAAFWTLFAVTVVVIGFMQIVSGPLITDAAPQGIVSFEFAGDIPNAEKMIDSWGQKERIYAGLSLGLDYLFLVLYSCTIALGCVLATRGMSTEFFIKTGVVLAWAQFAAALLDCLENFALIKLLLGSGEAAWSCLAFWCAGPKFFIVGVGLVYIVIGAVVFLIKRSR